MLASVMCCCAGTYQKITVWTSEKTPKPTCSTFLHHSALGQPLLGYGHVEPYVMRLGADCCDTGLHLPKPDCMGCRGWVCECAIKVAATLSEPIAIRAQPAQGANRMSGVRLGASVGGARMFQSLRSYAFQVFSATRPVARVRLTPAKRSRCLHGGFLSSMSAIPARP